MGEELVIIGGKRGNKKKKKIRKKNKVARNSSFSVLQWSIIQSTRYRYFI